MAGAREGQGTLARSEDRFRRLVEQIPAVTYVREVAGSDNPKAIAYTSPQYQDMLGYPPEGEMLEEGHRLEVVHTADRERVLAGRPTSTRRPRGSSAT